MFFLCLGGLCDGSGFCTFIPSVWVLGKATPQGAKNGRWRIEGGLVWKDTEVQESLVTALEACTFRSITGTTCILLKRLNRASPQNMGVTRVWSVLCVLAHACVCVCGNKCSGHILDPKHCFLQVSAISTSPAWGFYTVFLESLAMDGRSGGFAKVQMSLPFFPPCLFYDMNLSACGLTTAA